MKNLDLLVLASGLSTQPDVTDLIKRFIQTNQPSVVSFNPYNYTANDKYRPVMNGVYHSEGFISASDTHILITYKCDYNPEFEGKILAKDGSVIIGTYPNFKAVIPNGSDLTFVDISFPAILELEKEYNTDKKLKKGLIGRVMISGLCLDVTLMAKIARFALNFGITKFGSNDPLRAAKITDGTNTAIIMPCHITDNDLIKFYALPQ